ncbi:RHS Repeat family protein [Lysobacter capsici]|nr:RHS Repeat family protein [Lysobacter capsici]
MHMSKVLSLSTLALLCACASALAQSPLMPPVEYEKRIRATEMVTALSSGLFGDSVSLYNGSTEFAVTDIDIPGNSSLPVRLSRRFKVEAKKEVVNLGGFGAWDIDVPYVYGTFPANTQWNEGSRPTDNRCSNNWLPKIPFNHRLRDIWQGNFVHLPGGGDQEMLVLGTTGNAVPNDGQTYTRSTRDGMRFRCVANGVNNYPGEAFVGVDTSGTKYFFNTMAYRGAGAMKGTPTRPGFGRIRVYLMATRVEDRFGNGVNYNYGGSQGGQLLSVVADDGRRIDLEYDGGATVQRARANGRVWQYGYTGGGGALGINRFPLLASVTLPDQSAWTYSYNMPMQYGGLNPNYTPLDVDGGSCAEPDFGPETFTLTAAHPSGAVGTFVMPYTRLHRFGTPASACVPALENTNGNPDGPHELLISDYFDVYALARKTVTGTGGIAHEWTYDYGDMGIGRIDGPLQICPGCSVAKTVTVRNPDGSLTLHDFGYIYEYNDGQPLGTRTVSADNKVLRSESSEYVQYSNGTTMPFPWFYGELLGGDDSTSSMVRPLKKKIIVQDGATFTWQVDGSCTGTTGLCFDQFARPTKVIKSNTLGFSKNDTTEYRDGMTRWVLGQVQRSTTNGIETDRTEFHATTDLPIKGYAFGKLQQTVSYNADGTIATAADGNTNVTTFSNWKRGLPQSVTYADGTATSAVVDDNGWIRSVTDENGYAKTYDYDAAGRLVKIVYPTGDTVAWYDTVLRFEPVAATEVGLTAGHWRQTVTTGNRKKTTYFDALWRPVAEQEEDTSNPQATTRWSAKRYDHDGRVVFASYPRNPFVDGVVNFDSAMSGTSTSYDALGRATEVRQDSELGVLRTVTEYLPGMQQKVTNPRGKSVVTRYQAFDAPSYSLPIEQNLPTDAATYIRRDVFGKPLEIRRSGAP